MDYESRIGTQMMRIQTILDKELLPAFRQAEAETPTNFRNDAWNLLMKLGGDSGDGALEIQRDLERDIELTHSFADHWRSNDAPEIAHMVVVADKVEKELRVLQGIYDETPKSEQRRMNANVLLLRNLQGRHTGGDVFRLSLPVIGPGAAIVAYELYGLYAMIGVAWEL
jgi:hypothetical protein